MIKNEMNISLVTDTTNIKGTAVFGLLENDAVLPYTIGYIPWSMMENSGLLRLRSGLASAMPREIFDYTPETILNEPTRGVPFAYSYKSSWMTSEQFATLHDENGWKIPSNWTSQNALGLIHSYNTDSLRSSGNQFGGTIYFGIFTALENDGGVVTAYYTNTTLNTYDYINGTFTQNVTAYLAQNTPSSVTFTINDEKLKNSDNGIVHEQFENVSYYSNVGTLHVFWWIYQVGFSQNDSYCGGGVLLSENYRTNVGYRPYDFTAIQLDYGSSKNDVITVGYNDDTVYKQYASQYMQAFEELDDGGVLGRYAIIRYTNILITHGITYDDLRIIVCTASPYYYINGAYYVAEFTDDYYITGKLIPYSEAREWQKFINPDRNDFNPDDIPEPTPPGPEGDVAESGDNIDFTNVGTVGSANGFITLYGMNSSAIQEIGQVLWSSVFEGEYWKNILFVLTQSLDSGTIDVSEIIKFFISLKVFPFDLGIYRPGKNTIKFGTGISSLQLSSEVFPITNYTRELDAGMVHIPYIFNDFRDYTNCTISLFLPFCGSIQLNPMDVMGGDIYVKYLVDLTSGACTANVKLIRESHYYPIAMVSGQCASEVPITSTNAGRVISSQVGKMLNFAGEAHDWITDKAKQAAEIVLSGESGGGISPSAMDTDFKGVPFEVAKHVNNAYSAKAIVPYMISGTSGFTGFSAPNQCYVQIKFNHYANPNNYNRTVGQVTVKEKRVSECSGFTVCKNVETAGLSCSSEEKSMIKAILQNGFYA